MFKAIDTRTQTPVVILDPQWATRLGALRVAAKHGHIVCQTCQQPVVVRAGQIRRWYFAHRHRAHCPSGSESPELLRARAALYEWLQGKLGATASVTLEHMLPDHPLPRAIDCWVEGPHGPMAYWLVERQLRPVDRQRIIDAFTALAVPVHWVMLHSMLQRDPSGPGRLALSTTERELMATTSYDAPARPVGMSPGKSLHYLDAEGLTLTTFRGLHQWHDPGGYEGIERLTPLAELLIARRSGAFVHPGEYEARQAYEEQRRRFEEEQQRLREEALRRAEEEEQRWREIQRAVRAPILASPSPGGAGQPTDMSQGVGQHDPPRGEVADTPDTGHASGWGARPARCRHCGTETTDYWYYDGTTGECECRPCQRAGRG